MNCENCPKSTVLLGCGGRRSCTFVPGELFYGDDGCGVMDALGRGDREGTKRELEKLRNRFQPVQSGRLSCVQPNLQNIPRGGAGLKLEKKWGFEVGDWVQHTGTSFIGVVCGFGGEIKGPSWWDDAWVMINDRESCFHKDYAVLLSDRPQQPTDWPEDDFQGDPRIVKGALVVLHRPHDSCGIFGDWKGCIGEKGVVTSAHRMGKGGYRLAEVSLMDGRKPRWRVQDCTFVKMMEDE